MTIDVVANAKRRFGCPVYVSKNGDIMVDMGGRAIVATSRELRLNRANMNFLWAVRFFNARNAVSGYLASGEWVEA